MNEIDHSDQSGWLTTFDPDRFFWLLCVVVFLAALPYLERAWRAYRRRTIESDPNPARALQEEFLELGRAIRGDIDGLREELIARIDQCERRLNGAIHESMQAQSLAHEAKEMAGRIEDDVDKNRRAIFASTRHRV